MKDSQVRELDAGQRVRAYAKTRPADFPAGSRAAIVLAVVGAAITEVEQQAARQVAANLDYQESTEQKQAAINTVLEQRRAISQTARSINPQLPGIADQFKMGRGGSDQELLNRARADIINATPIATEFTSRDLPASFLTDLQAAIDAVDAAEDRQSAALAAQTAATAALAAALKQLREALSELDAIMRNKYRTDPGALAAWRSASRVERAPKKAKKAAPPPPST